jgi:hypothetical protein
MIFGLWQDWTTRTTPRSPALARRLYELAIRPSLWKAGGLLVSVLVVLCLASVLWRRVAAGKP